jgi:hypothetical protein
MKYFIKLWPDNTATLVTNHGKTLMVFENIEEARHALRRLTTKPTPNHTNLTPITQHPLHSAA